MRTKHEPDCVIALEGRLRRCRNVLTLGVKTNFSDYSEADIRLIRDAQKIYYPSVFYADLFDAIGKPIFPSYHTYKCVQDKIKQTALLNLLGIAHPRTRIFYGKRQKRAITQYFEFPFIAKVPRGSAMGRGVFLVTNDNELKQYLSGDHPAYIQEYLPMDRDIRVVIIGNKVVHAYWRIASKGDFRSNISAGGTIELSPVPQPAIALALETAMLCRWDDVGLDICYHNNQYWVLEANMKYGKEGFRAAGIDYDQLMENMISNNEI